MAKHRRPPVDDPSTGPEVPVEMVDLLAPPIVVGVARVPVTSRATPPGAPTIRPATPPGSAPARRPAPVPGQTGRHRCAKEPAERG
ncbi:hypothetical protein ABZ807_05210 [Micromonospora sp. NPDC047548]|uniref:hypothetical protein n=1 Tax=Micromonospora sp. NPDC047548 TaxID=3155624 RepID=UPI0033E70028